MGVVVEVKCRNGHKCVVLPKQIGPLDYPICESCYKPMHPVATRAQRPSDVVYKQGRPT